MHNLKQDLADVTVEFLRPFQERVKGISDEELNRILSVVGRRRADCRRYVSRVLRGDGNCGSVNQQVETNG